VHPWRAKLHPLARVLMVLPLFLSPLWCLLQAEGKKTPLFLR
jgi:hypothetical protein